MKTDDLVKIVNNKKRVGRGEGSGKGKTCGRGHKGQNARSGTKNRPTFEGGQTPLVKRLPKLGGFKRDWDQSLQVVNLSDLSKKYKKKEKVAPETLFKKGLIDDPQAPVKILAKGSLDKKLEFENCSFSKKAAQKANIKERKKKEGGKNRNNDKGSRKKQE